MQNYQTDIRLSLGVFSLLLGSASALGKITKTLRCKEVKNSEKSCQSLTQMRYT